MNDTPRDKKPLWKHLAPLNLLGLALGLFIYFLRLQFNINLLVRNSTEDITFSWTGLFLYVIPCILALNFFGWFGYLQENISDDKN